VNLTLVRQSFTYNNEKLITIYHIGLESPHTDLEFAKENSLSFSEETLDDRDIESQNTLIIQGFLPLSHPKNPYTTYCCNYREEIHGAYEEKMHLFNSSQFNDISQFVKEWSGLDLQRTPLSLFNTLILRPTEYVVTVRLDKSENLLVKIDRPRSKVTQIECLKLIVESTIHGINTGYIEYYIPRNTNELEREFCVALPKPLLGGIDVELIEGNSLVYASYDTHFIRTIKINLDLIKEIGRYTTDYKKINKREMPIIETSNGSQAIVGNKDQSVISTYLYMEDQLSISKQGSLFKFLTRNNSEEFFKFLEGLLKANSQAEIWFFDPFLLEYGSEGKERFIDTMKTILFHVSNQRKHFIFNCCDSSYTGNEDQYLSQRLKSIKEYMKEKKIRDVAAEFVCVDISFHDRFVFVTKNSRPTKGFLLGTSLNSMGENYSSIVQLSQKDAEYTFSVLISEIYTGSRRLAEAKL